LTSRLIQTAPRAVSSFPLPDALPISPFGRFNDEVAITIAAMGFETIAHYDVSSYDWNDQYTEEDVITRIMSRVQPGSVIVMHILNDIHTPSVLPDVIETLQNDGYEFVLTSEWVE